MITIDARLFHTIERAVWILDKQLEVIAKTKEAEKLETAFQLDKKAIFEISQGEGCMLHSTQETCLDCPLEGNVSPIGFPFILLDKQGEETEFWGRVDQTNDQILLQIAPKVAPSVEKERSMFGYLNNAREAERKKIAQDLHDGIAQSVYSLMLETRTLKWFNEEEQTRKLKEIDRHFSSVLLEIRNLAKELRPMTLDEFGLEQALEQFVERILEMTGFEINLSILGKSRGLNEAVRLAVYRIIQEAVTNAMKYSGENDVSVILDYQEKLTVTIRDDGIGFDFTCIEQGFGLLNMQERARSVKGELVLFSKPNKGTTITLNVPLEGG